MDGTDSWEDLCWVNGGVKHLQSTAYYSKGSEERGETYSVCGGECESVRNIINAMERCWLSDSSRTILWLRDVGRTVREEHKHTHIHTNKPRAYDYQRGKIDGGAGVRNFVWSLINSRAQLFSLVGQEGCWLDRMKGWNGLGRGEEIRINKWLVCIDRESRKRKMWWREGVSGD